MAIVISTVESNFHVSQVGFYPTESHRLDMTVNVLTEPNVKIVNQLIEGVFNQHNADRIGDFFAKNGKWHGGVLGTVEGVENMIGLFRGVFSAMPDLHLTVQEVIAQGDTVVVRVVVEGTHKGNLLGVSASGQHLRWDGVDLYRLANGKVTDDWAGDDWLAIMVQAGAFKPPWIPGQSTEEVVKAFIALYNRHNFDAYSPMLDQSIVLYSPLFPDGVKGIEGRKKIEENFLKSMPDFEFKILDITSKGGFVAAELIGAGTSTGPAEIPGRPPIPPTGRRVEFRLGSFFRVNSKGLIEEERYYYDSAGVLKQLRG